MIALGEDGLADITRQLVGTGGGRDTSARFALNAMAVWASRFGNEAKRAIAERAFIRALESARDVEVRTFLLSQLQIVGQRAIRAGGGAVPADAALVEPATQLMLAVKGPAANRALIAALPGAAGPGSHHHREGARRPERRGGARPGAGAREGRRTRDAEGCAGGPRALRQSEIVEDDARGGRSSRLRVRAVERHGRAARLRAEPRRARRHRCRREALPADHEEDRSAPGGCPPARRRSPCSSRRAAPTRCPNWWPPSTTRTAPTGRRLCGRLNPSAAPPRSSAGPPRPGTVDAERRAEIVDMLGRQGDARALPFIRASLAAREPEVVLAAAGAIAHMERAGRSARPAARP